MGAEPQPGMGGRNEGHGGVDRTLGFDLCINDGQHFNISFSAQRHRKCIAGLLPPQSAARTIYICDLQNVPNSPSHDQ
jgi:hypothetical protein